jgi:hypothetical protein
VEGEVYIGFWFGNLKEREHLEDVDVNEGMLLIST